MINPAAAHAHRVAIVVDPDYRDQLGTLSTKVHVWIAESPANRKAVEEIGRAGRGVSLEQGITTFRIDEGQPPERWAIDILSTVIEHHGEFSHSPPLSIIEIYGCACTSELATELADLGFPSIVHKQDYWHASARPAV